LIPRFGLVCEGSRAAAARTPLQDGLLELRDVELDLHQPAAGPPLPGHGSGWGGGAQGVGGTQ